MLSTILILHFRESAYPLFQQPVTENPSMVIIRGKAGWGEVGEGKEGGVNGDRRKFDFGW